MYIYQYVRVILEIKMSNVSRKQHMTRVAELAVFGEFWHFRNHADLQTAWHLQGHRGVARLGESLAESGQQLTALAIVE